MKHSNLSKFVGAGVLTLSMAILPLTLPASAQSDTGSGTTETAPSTTGDNMQSQGTDNTVAGEEGDRDFDWGWLGLIGLAGLAGLARKREEPTRYRDPADPANRIT